jgi:hypothetical protein
VGDEISSFIIVRGVNKSEMHALSNLGM